MIALHPVHIRRNQFIHEAYGNRTRGRRRPHTWPRSSGTPRSWAPAPSAGARRATAGPAVEPPSAPGPVDQHDGEEEQRRSTEPELQPRRGNASGINTQ